MEAQLKEKGEHEMTRIEMVTNHQEQTMKQDQIIEMLLQQR